MGFCATWKGKLVIGWPPPERSWWRRAHRNVFPVHAILEDSAVAAAMPAWDQIDLGWDELRVLPSRWREALSHWRGIYYIFDQAAGKGYVGSAYGDANLLGRWVNYAASGHGGNTLLRQRDPKNFRFTILQRVSPDMDAADVIRLEGTWKERLHTRHPFGLNDNSPSPRTPHSQDCRSRAAGRQSSKHRCDGADRRLALWRSRLSPAMCAPGRRSERPRGFLAGMLSDSGEH
jgi:GIY-YIG catalytic domain